MSGLRLQNLTKRFGATLAVNDVSLTVGATELLAIVGPSGSGKTTLLRLVAGLEVADAGEIYLADRRIDHLRPRRRNLGFVFQDFALLPYITTFENIAYGLRSRKVERREIRRRVEESAEKLRLTHLLKRYPDTLSGGERQRVALARALVRDCAAILFDEPLSSLDAPLRRQARADILALHHHKQRPSLYVTHDQRQAMALGDRIAVINTGCIEQVAPPQVIYERPATRFVADFVGHGVNWLECDTCSAGSAAATPPIIPPPAAKAAAIRPEHVLLSTCDHAHFSGIVTQHDRRLIIVKLPNDTPLKLYIANQKLPTIGTTAHLTIDTTKLLWFDQEERLIDAPAV